MMCLIAMGIANSPGPGRPTRFRGPSSAADVQIARDESLDRQTRIAARERIGFDPLEEAEPGAPPTPFPDFTDDDLKEVQFKKRTARARGEGGGGLGAFDPAVAEARARAMEQLFPTATPQRQTRIGVPALDPRGVRGFNPFAGQGGTIGATGKGRIGRRVVSKTGSSFLGGR